jgi:hypothetical protein
MPSSTDGELATSSGDQCHGSMRSAIRGEPARDTGLDGSNEPPLEGDAMSAIASGDIVCAAAGEAPADDCRDTPAEDCRESDIAYC